MRQVRRKNLVCGLTLAGGTITWYLYDARVSLTHGLENTKGIATGSIIAPVPTKHENGPCAITPTQAPVFIPSGEPQTHAVSPPRLNRCARVPLSLVAPMGGCIPGDFERGDLCTVGSTHESGRIRRGSQPWVA
jgi:hypothetical protein